MISRSFTRRSFLKTFGTVALAAPFVTRGWAARPPSRVLRHASFGASNMAGHDIRELTKFTEVELVAVAEVDLERAQRVKERFPSARIYQDWRELLDKEAKRIDSVNVSTPDHMHAVMAMSALQLGKHVYCQKPLAHDLHEVRKLTEAACQKKAITQMGIQIHASGYYKLATLLVQAGAIGRVKEVHAWCPTSWGDPKPRPVQIDPVPPKLSWDLWLGVCEERPYIGDGYYHPVNWRKRLDFGTGSLGDMGCHIFDPIFTSLELTAPSSVRSEGAAPNQWNWALDSTIHYVFPGTRFTADTTLPFTWYDGTAKPPAEVLALLEGDNPPNSGSILVGTQGALVIPHVARPLLYPDKKFKDFTFPEVVSGDHWGQFVRACLGRDRTNADFSYAGPLTEAVLAGAVATHFPQTTLKWNATKLEFDLRDANRFLRHQYRQGWSVPGLTWSV